MARTAQQIAALVGITLLVWGQPGQVGSHARAQAGAPAASFELLGARIGDMIRSAGLGDALGVSVVDLSDGREVFSHQGHRALNPASNMKIITAGAALRELGGDFRMLTVLQGRQVGDSIVGGLFLRGTGDPDLRETDLIQLAQDLAARGVRKVDELFVDGSYFDDQVLPPAFDQQPDEISPFRAAVAAVSINRNAYTLTVRPGERAGDAVEALTEAPGHFEIDNAMTTGSAGPPSVVAIQRGDAEVLSLKLRGNVPVGIGRLSYRRRVRSPLHFAGFAMVEALRSAKIQVPRRATVRSAPTTSPVLASHSSAPLAQLLQAMGKDSDNFTAEMVLKVLGAERERKPGASADGVNVVLRVLKSADVPVSRLSMVNGSGLFDGNQLAASHLTRFLASLHADPALRPEFLAQLAVGGVDGTLAHRFGDLPAARVVRAKSGTLADVIALSGYVLGPQPGRDLAFSFLANGVRGKHQAARGLADGIVGQLVRYLHAARRSGSPASVVP